MLYDINYFLAYFLVLFLLLVHVYNKNKNMNWWYQTLVWRVGSSNWISIRWVSFFRQHQTFDHKIFIVNLTGFFHFVTEEKWKELELTRKSMLLNTQIS